VSEPRQDNLTGLDLEVTATDNGPQPDDPAEQPPQDPEWVPEGSVSEVRK
jgi:hypothetical protein